MPEQTASDIGPSLASLWERVALALCLVTSVVLLSWLFFYSNYGLDLSDEGFYLNSIADPAAYPVNVPPTLFGYVWYWPYHLLGGNIALLRGTNIALTAAVGWGLGFGLIRRLWPDVPGLSGLIIASSIGLLALASFRWWLLTPSYNSLAIQALMIITMGLLLCSGPGVARQIAACVLIGVGGWLCVLAKPTTAAAAGFVVIIYFVTVRPRSLFVLIGSAAFSLLLLAITAVAIDGSVTEFTLRMIRSAQATTMLGSGQELSRIVRVDALDANSTQIAAGFAAGLGLWLTLTLPAWWRWLSYLAVAGLALGSMAIAITGIDPTGLLPSALFVVPVGLVLAAIARHWRFIAWQQNTASLTIGLILLAMPHLYALGTNNNYWVSGSLAGIFWMLSAVSFLAPLARFGEGKAVLITLAVLSQLLTASMLNQGMQSPHRQVAEVRSYHERTSLPGGELILPRSFAQYITSAKAVADAAGLQPGTPSVDLSGRSPGLLYVLQTRPLGQPWMVGAYPGSDDIAIATLRLTSCADLAGAWLLIEPQGPRHLDEAAVLNSFGATLNDYAATDSFSTPINDGDYPDPYPQHLLRPIRASAVAEQACGAARRIVPEKRIWSQ